MLYFKNSEVYHKDELIGSVVKVNNQYKFQVLDGKQSEWSEPTENLCKKRLQTAFDIQNIMINSSEC